MNEFKIIKARRSDGSIQECSVQISLGTEWKLLFFGVGLEHEVSGNDIFEAFNSLRKILEELDIQLLCAGARPDVYPSAMSRDMGGGRQAYITKLGRPALRSNLVDIFDYSDLQSVGSVSDQRAFHEKWIVSLKSS